MDGGHNFRDDEHKAQWIRLVAIADPFGSSTKVKLTQCSKPMLIDFLVETTALLVAERRQSTQLEDRNAKLEQRVVQLEKKLARLIPHS